MCLNALIYPVLITILSFVLNLSPNFDKNLYDIKQVKNYIKLLKKGYSNGLTLELASNYREKILQISIENNLKSYIAETEYLYGLIQRNKSDLKGAKISFNTCLDLAIEIKTDTLISKAYHGFGLIAYEQNDLKQSKIYLQKALKNIENIEKSRYKAILLNSFGAVAFIEGNYDKSFEYYIKSLKSIGNLNLPEHKATLYNNIGSIIQSQGNNEKAIEYFQKGLNISLSHDLKRNEIYFRRNISNIFKLQQKYDLAIAEAKIAMVIARETNNETQLLRCYNNIAEIYSLSKKYKEAKQYYDKLYQLSTKNNKSNYLALSYIGGVICNLKLGENTNQNYTKTLNKYLKKVDKPFFKFKINFLLGEYYHGINKNKKALSILEKNLEKVNNVPLSERGLYTLKSIDLIHDAYTNINNYKKADYYSTRHIKYFDSILKANETNKINSKIFAYDFENQKAEIEKKVAKHQQINKAQLKQQKAYTSLVFLAFLFSLSVIAFVYKSFLNKKKLNTILESQKQSLDDMDMVKSKILAVIGHDLKTPLTSLNSLLHLISNGDINSAEVKQNVKHLKNNFDIAYASLDNILYWARNQMAGIIQKPTQIQLEPYINKLLPLFGNQINAKHIKVHSDIDENSSLIIDDNQLNLILRNIISNAIKFTPLHGTITLKAKNIGKMCYITVTDTGVGMNAHTKESIFKSVIEHSSAGTAGEAGTGLGLMLCKDYINNNNGEIWAESEINKGTSIHIRLPLN